MYMYLYIYIYVYMHIYIGLVKEQKFFQSHPKYRDMLAKCGTTNLARSLNQILMMHIRYDYICKDVYMHIYIYAYIYTYIYI
jgi:uncharacterized membrane protein